MKLSFCTLGCPNWTLSQAIENAVAMGFDGVEIRGAAGEHIGPQEPAESRAAIRAAFAAAKIAPACIMGYSRFTYTDETKRQTEIENILNMLDVARDIGCPMLRVFGGKLETLSREEGIRKVVDAFKIIVPRAQKNHVKLALESHDAWCKGEHLRMVIDAVASPALGVCWDIANASEHEPIEKTYAAIKDFIFHVHFKDVAKNEQGKFHSVLPGTGGVDLQRALTLLHTGGYTGWLSFEWEKKWEPTLAEPEVAFPHFQKFTSDLMKKVGVPRG